MSDLEHDDTTPCAADKCTRPAATGTVLCAPDVRRLGDWLAQIGTEYELLSAAPSMQGREVGSIGGGTLASQRSPARLDVLTLTDRRTALGAPGDRISYGSVTSKGTGPWCLFCSHETCTAWRAGRRRDIYDDELAVGSNRAMSAFGILNGWAELVRESRELTVARPLTVASERKLLAGHFDWILAQDWAGEFHDEMRRLYAVLRAANGYAAPTTRMRRLHVPCTACGVRAITHRPGDGQACCENCGVCTVLEEERISA